MVEVIAELSGNHGGSLEKMLDLILSASECGCDYAKFQLYRPEDMPDRDRYNNEETYKKYMVPADWLPAMFAEAKQARIGLFASVFSVRAVEELLLYDPPFIKIASPLSTKLDESVYDDIECYIPRNTGLIVSSDSTHVKPMWNWPQWGRPIIKMYCPPGHPQVLIDEDYQLGYSQGVNAFSDHSAGITASLSVLREVPTVKMIEKHFMADGDVDCIDHHFSADSETMELLCKLAHNR